MKYLLASILCSFYALSAQWATISSDKAVIYSDQQMTSEIGFIKRGVKVRVGEVPRNRGSLLPIVVNKKIAYIKVKDLKSSKEEKLVVSATARRREIKKKSKEQSRLGLAYSRFLLSIEDIEDSTVSDDYAFNGGALKGYLKNNYSALTYSAEIEYSVASDEEELNEFQMYTFAFDVLYRVIDFDNLSLSVLAGAVLVPLAQYTYDGENNQSFTSNSSGLGGTVGAELFLGLDESIGLHGNLKYRYLEIFEFDVPENERLGFESKYNPTFSGVSFQAALTYVF